MEGVGEEESGGRDDGARLSVTQSDDPRSGGHFAVGMSKPPLDECANVRRCAAGREVYGVMAGKTLGQRTEGINDTEELTPGPPENVVE